MSQTRLILVMDPLSPKMEQFIRQNLPDHYEIIFCNEEKDRNEYISMADVLVTFTQGISKDWLERAERCQFIQKLGAGVNNIDINGANTRAIPVANTSGLNATAVAELTITLMLASLRHVITAHNQITNEGVWLKTGLRDFSYQLTGKNVGLIGLGNIGRKVAQLTKGFDCNILYYDTRRLSFKEEETLQVNYCSLDRLLTESDVVSLHVPRIKETYHLINEERLNLMKPTSVLINTCRGGVVDEEALYEALYSKKILAAGLDVFEKEPINQGHNLASLPNVILTPHFGGGTVEAMELVASKACKNIVAYVEQGKFADEKDIVNLDSISSRVNE
ncbi:2-hydroxyacid dehydrogenase [Salirhabdus salicampi]|uniref:2-hydroxyacid dehydrogenase n=1 Tax=Salirhabdus salicampi TaxID=476102 RepID=UPI0020C2DA4C|nr:2-hydroxyacid dehydrogenase [Salirhabdus salicampi]MCP8615666.1 2-hydroxyacid dehydrogenase [Salirhabdus salicampi]